MKTPLAFVVSVRSALVDRCRSETLALSSGRPLESVTVPRMTPVVAWAWACSRVGRARTARRSARTAGIRRRSIEHRSFREPEGLGWYPEMEGTAIAYRPSAAVARSRCVACHRPATTLHWRLDPPAGFWSQHDSERCRSTD